MDLSPLPLLLDATEDLLPRPTPQLGVWSLYESYCRSRYGSLSPSLTLPCLGELAKQGRVQSPVAMAAEA